MSWPMDPSPERKPASSESVLLAAPASDSYRESESRSRPREPSPRASFAVTLSSDAMAPTRRS